MSLSAFVTWFSGVKKWALYFIPVLLSLQIELHVHLDGAIRIKTIVEVAK